MNIFAAIYTYVDKTSVNLLGFTGLFAGIASLTLSNWAAVATILAAITTAAYNIHKIIKESKK